MTKKMNDLKKPRNDSFAEIFKTVYVICSAIIALKCAS
jgi:hypothetical protein